MPILPGPPGVAKAIVLAVWALCALLSGTARGQDLIEVRCSVFHDLDADGTRDAGEPALPGIRITNGRDVLLTDGTGAVTVTVDRLEYRFAALTVPRGYWPTTPWYHWVPVGTAGPDTVEFGLETSAASAADTVRWVHIADSQVYSASDPVRLSDDLLEINQVDDAPLFVINTGDLVEVGSDTTHWDNYVTQIAVSAFPVLPVVGNHDLNGTSLDYYERWVGPPYYSFDCGNWHFVVYNSEKASIVTPALDAWLLNDLQAAPSGTHIAVFQHRQLIDTADSTVAVWDSLGVEANFSGHWHCTQLAVRPNGMKDFNISRTTRGPADRTPRVFGLVTCADDGNVSYDLRRLSVDHRVSITLPAPAQTVGRDFLDVVVQAYDTSSRVSGLSVSVTGTGGTLPATALSREGVSAWRATLDAASLPVGAYVATVTGMFEDGTFIFATQVFALADIVPIVRDASGDWPMFRKCPQGSSFVATPLPPPLEPLWSTAVPGMIGLSSPVVAGGKVYLGTRGETGTGDAALVALDAVSGTIDWQTSFVGGGVALAPAVSQGRVFVNALSESSYAFDATTGAGLWSAPAPDAGYVVTAVTVQEPSVFVGGEPKCREVLTANGAALWVSSPLGSAFFPGIYSAPTLGGANVYYGFWDVFTIPQAGFSVVSRSSGSVTYSEPGPFRSPVAAPDTIYTIGGTSPTASYLSARDASGNVLWTGAQTVGRGTASPALGHGVLVVGTELGDILGLRVSDGIRIWSHPVGQALYGMVSGVRSGGGTNATAAIADSVVYVGSLDGNLYALDLATGAELWRFFLGVPIASSAAISGNMLFVGASDGHLYAFGSRAAPVTSAPASEGAPGRLALAIPRPNPTRAATWISWVQPVRAPVRVRVYDVTGRAVRTLLHAERSAGRHQLEWDGAAEDGKAVAAGVYLVQVEAGSERAAQRIVRIR